MTDKCKNCKCEMHESEWGDYCGSDCLADDRNNEINQLQAENARLNLRCTMLEAEFDAALTMAEKCSLSPTKKEAIEIYTDFIENTKFETTLAKRDLLSGVRALTNLASELGVNDVEGAKVMFTTDKLLEKAHQLTKQTEKL